MRPQKPKAERKQETLRIRVTADQKRALTSAARRAGLDLSTWVRVLALRAAGLLESEKELGPS
jgi:uncharacterized protein (DUF1778 family)